MTETVEDLTAHRWTDADYHEWVASLKEGDAIIFEVPGSGEWSVLKFAAQQYDGQAAFRTPGPQFVFKTLDEAVKAAHDAGLIIRSVDRYQGPPPADRTPFAPDRSDERT